MGQERAVLDARRQGQLRSMRLTLPLSAESDLRSRDRPASGLFKPQSGLLRHGLVLLSHGFVFLADTTPPKGTGLLYHLGGFPSKARSWSDTFMIIIDKLLAGFKVNGDG